VDYDDALASRSMSVDEDDAEASGVSHVFAKTIVYQCEERPRRRSEIGEAVLEVYTTTRHIPSL